MNEWVKEKKDNMKQLEIRDRQRQKKRKMMRNKNDRYEVYEDINTFIKAKEEYDAQYDCRNKKRNMSVFSL